MARALKNKGLRIVSILNRKGGVGKTVTALEIATGLANMGERVLLVDADPQGNLTYFFTDIVKNGFHALVEELLKGMSVFYPQRYIIEMVRENLDLIPSFPSVSPFALSEKQSERIMTGFLSLFGSLKKQYDWIIFDCSPSYHMLDRLIIRASEAVLIPLEFQVFSISGLGVLMEQIKECAREVERTIDIAGLIFTRVESRLKRVQAYREVFNEYHIPIFEVHKSETLAHSLELKKTIWEYFPGSRSGIAYKAIIERIFLGDGKSAKEQALESIENTHILNEEIIIQNKSKEEKKKSKKKKK